MSPFLATGYALMTMVLVIRHFSVLEAMWDSHDIDEARRTNQPFDHALALTGKVVRLGCTLTPVFLLWHPGYALAPVVAAGVAGLFSAGFREQLNAAQGWHPDYVGTTARYDRWWRARFGERGGKQARRFELGVAAAAAVTCIAVALA